MKKILAAVAATALIGGGGYFYATQKFATEAGYLKEALEQGGLFKADSIEIKPYKFNVYIVGFTIDLSTLPDLINKMVDADIPTLKIKYDYPYELQYSPFSKKLAIFSRAKDTRLVVDFKGQKTSYIVSNYKGETILDLSETPELKDKTLAQFIKQYVIGVKMVGNDVKFQEEGSQDSMFSADFMESGIQTQPSDLGQKVTLFSKVKGEQSNLAAMFDAMAKFLPQNAPELKGVLGQIKPSPLLQGLKRDKTSTMSVEADFNSVIDSIVASLMLTDEAAKQAELASLLTKLKGVKFFIDGEDQLLGAKLKMFIDVSAPMTLPQGRVKAKLDAHGNSSKEFQEKLPEIISETLRQNMTLTPDTQQDVEKMIAKVKSALTNHAPNLVSMGRIGFNLDVDAEPSRLEGNALLDIYCDLYGAKLTVDSKDGNIKAVLRVTNAEQLFVDFEAYATKFMNDPEMVDMVSPELKTQLPTYMALVKTTLKSMAKESKDSKGNSVLEIEQVVPASVLAGVAGGAAALAGSQ